MAAWAAVLAVFVPPLLSGKVFVDDPALLDVTFNFMPFFYWVGDTYRHGQFPLWNPHILFGMPHLGYPHSSSLYPPAVALYTLLPYIYASSFNIIFHSLIASCLIYFIMKDHEVPPLLSACAGIIFVLSGWYFGLLNIFWALGSTNGVLLMWLSMRKLLRKPTLGWWLAGAAGTAWTGFSGDLELLTLAIIGLSIMAVISLAGEPRVMWQRMFILAASLLLGGLIMSAVALPTLESLHFSIRGPAFPYKMRFITAQSFSPAIMPTWFFPLLSAKQRLASSAFNSGLSPLYQGFLVPLLFIFALVFERKDREQRAMAAAIIFFLCLIIFKEFTTVGRHVLERVPIINFSQMPEKAAFFFDGLILAVIFRSLSKRANDAPGAGPKSALALALIAGGLTLILTQHLSFGGPERYFLGGAACILGALAILPGKIKPLLTARRMALAAGILLAAEVFSLAVRYVPHTDPARFGLNPGLEKFARSLNPYDRYAIFEELITSGVKNDPPIFGLFEVESGALNIVAPQRVPPARSILFSSLIYRDMFYTGASGAKFFNNWSMTNPGTLDRGEMHLFNLAGTRIIVSRDKSVPYSSPYSLARLNALAWKRTGPAFGPPDAEVLILVHCPTRLDAPLASEPDDELKIKYKSGPSAAGAWLGVLKNSDAGQGKILYWRFSQPGENQNASLPLSDFANSPATLSLVFLDDADRADIKVAGLEIVNPLRPLQRTGAWGNVEAFENRDALPRSFVSREIAVVSGLQNITNWVRDRGRFSPPRQVVLEKDYPEAGKISALPPQESALEKIAITSYAANEVQMDARLLGPGVLVFTDTYFPGWRLFDRQAGELKELRIVPADLAFRAAFLNKGDHKLRWVYQPLSFKIGLWASIAFILSTVPLLLLRRL